LFFVNEKTMWRVFL